MKTFATCLTVVVIGSVGLAHAQNCGKNRCGTAPMGHGVPGRHNGFCGPVAGHVRHASMIVESAQPWMAARIQAQAQYDLFSSLAAVNMAQAQRIEMENRQYRIEANRSQYGSSKSCQAENAQDDDNAVTVAWPPVLQKPRYDGFRKVAEQVIAKVNARHVHPGDWTRLQKAARLLAKKLGSEKPGDAQQARQFVADLLAGGLAGLGDFAAN